jgi:nicotinamide-nucleotide amidase
MGKELIEDTHTRELIKGYLENYVKNQPTRKITKNNWKQAMVPEGGIVLDNKNGTAPGLIIEENGKSVILLPGPPGELIPMFEHQVFPYLRKKQPEIIYSKVVKICGIGESKVETDISDLIVQQTNPTIAPYAKTGEVHLRITTQAKSEAAADLLIGPVVRELRLRFGEHIYTTDEHKTLEETVIELLREQGFTLTTVESCTGGALSARIVNVAGASDVLKQGFITYSNRAKETYVKVEKSILETEGAVSQKCAEAMAKGGNMVTGADVTVAVTGIAGPGGGTSEKPVGTVFIGCCIKDHTVVREFHFNGERDKIREQSVVNALILLRKCILENSKS